MDEQMRLFESEVGNSALRRGPAFMPSSVRAHQQQHGGGLRPGMQVPPPPSYARPQFLQTQYPARPGFAPLRGPPSAPPNLPQKQFSAAPQIVKPADADAASNDDDDILATLMKYEKEVKEDKGDKKKRRSDEQGGSNAKAIKSGSEHPANAAAINRPGTEVTPDEIRQKAKQMVEAVKASQVVEKTKKLNQQNQKGGKKQKKMIRMAGGQMWEDSSLQTWDPNDFRLFCGDLGNDVTDEVLNRTFGKYPSFQQAKVVRDKRTNKTKGYGFVSFKDPADFTKAIKEMDGKYVGSRPIKLRRSNWKDRNIEQVKTKQKTKTTMGFKS